MDFLQKNLLKKRKKISNFEIYNIKFFLIIKNPIFKNVRKGERDESSSI